MGMSNLPEPPRPSARMDSIRYARDAERVSLGRPIETRDTVFALLSIAAAIRDLADAMREQP